MQTVLIVIHIMVVLALIATVLLQRSEGGALGIGGGGFMTGRGQANVLTRATAILAAMFFATSLGLTLLANFGHSNRSIFENAVAPASAPTQGTVLQQLQKEQQERAQQPQVPAPPGEPEAPRSQ
jgi:preprotein translocase subunit SecG